MAFFSTTRGNDKAFSLNKGLHKANYVPYAPNPLYVQDSRGVFNFSSYCKNVGNGASYTYVTSENAKATSVLHSAGLNLWPHRNLYGCFAVRIAT